MNYLFQEHAEDILNSISSVDNSKGGSSYTLDDTNCLDSDSDLDLQTELVRDKLQTFCKGFPYRVLVFL